MSLHKRTVHIAIIITFALLAVSIYNIPSVDATEPSDIVLTYDFNSQTLTVNVSHYVSNTKTHYIETIEIKNNEISILNKTYVNQTYNWGMYDSFTVSTSIGDNLTVTATCKRGHSLTRWLIVSSTTTTSSTTETTSTTTTTDGPDSPGAALDVSPVIVVGIVLVIFFILFFAWLEPDRFPGGSRIRAGLLWFWEKLRGGISWLVTRISSVFQQIKDKVSSK